MTREFPDELLSALLDDELSPAERAEVESHLAGSEADRQLVAELKSLRADVATLPMVNVSSGFADRVVQAAVAEAQRLDPNRLEPNRQGVHRGNDHRGFDAKSPPPVQRSSKSWMVGAAAASAAALAACFLLLVAQPWRPVVAPNRALPIAAIPASGVDQAVALKDQFLWALSAATPADGEAIVFRLRAGSDVSKAFDAALVKAGIAPQLPADSTAAAAIVSAYGRIMNEKALADASVAAADAILVEAPLERLEAVFGELASAFKEPLELEAAMKLALKSNRPEAGPAAAQSTVLAFAQHLDAGLFRLEKRLADAATLAVAPQSAVGSLDPQQRVRCLILVEAP